MGADEDVTGFAGADGGGHDDGVAGVEAAGDVGDVDEREEVIVGALGVSNQLMWLGDGIIAGANKHISGYRSLRLDRR